MGAGVAGLQAIATARRLGAVVSAYDVRSAAKEEVKSLGATFLELPLEAQEGAGGYAGEQSEAFLARQQEMIGTHVAASDVVITTAAIPGRRAPVLVTAAMVGGMRARLDHRRLGRGQWGQLRADRGRPGSRRQRGSHNCRFRAGVDHADSRQQLLLPQRQLISCNCS